MLKKILAASTAGVLALTALASTAMAASDPYTIVIEKTASWEYKILDITASLDDDDIKALLGNGTSAETASPVQDSKNSYSNMAFSVWVSDTVINKTFTNDKGNSVTNPKFYDIVSIKSASVDIDLAANVQEYVNVANGVTYNYLDTTASPAAMATKTVANTAGELVPKGVKGGPAYNGTLTANTYAIDLTNVPVTSENSFKKEVALNTGLDLKSDNGSAQNGKVTKPVIVNGTYNLANEKQLLSVDYDKSTIDLKFQVRVPKAAYEQMVAGVTGNQQWGTNDDTWDNNYISDLLNSAAGQQVLNTYLGIAAESGTNDPNANPKYVRKGGVTAVNAMKVEVKDDDNGSAQKDMWADWQNGLLQVGLGVNSTPTKLQNMNNGGTITFTFNKAIPDNQFVSAEIVYRNASGHAVYSNMAGEIANVPLDNRFAYGEEGQTEITVPFPAGLTYAAGTTNPYKSFALDVNLNKSWNGVVADPSVTDSDFGLIRVTIKANKEAPKDDNNSGGLVNSGDSTSTSTPSSNTNSGSNNGEKNPGTGVAVAVAPVVLAAAGAAVVISKKRK